MLYALRESINVTAMLGHGNGQGITAPCPGLALETEGYWSRDYNNRT